MQEFANPLPGLNDLGDCLGGIDFDRMLDLRGDEARIKIFRCLEKQGAETLKQIPLKEIFFTFLRLLAKGKIKDLGDAIPLSLAASTARCELLHCFGSAKGKSLNNLEALLLSKHIYKLLNIERTSFDAEADLTRFAKDDGASAQEIAALKEKVSEITQEELVAATGLTPEETIHAHSGLMQ